MAKLPRIDFTDFLALLKQEGKSELRAVCAKTLGESGQKILKEWDEIIKGLDEIVPKLAEGAEAGALIGPVKRIGKSASSLSLMASQVLSFIPGPIGMVCSAINALVCFCTLPFPMNLCNGFLELLGCIPGGKFAGKMAPQMEKILAKMIEKAGLKDLLLSKGRKPLMNFIEKNFSHVAEPPVPPKVKPKATGVGNYSTQSKNPSFGDIIQHNSQRTGKIKCGQPGQYSPNYGSINYEEFILRTNTGKYNPYSHLF